MKKIIGVITSVIIFASCQLKGHFPDGTKISFEHESLSYFKLKKGDTIDIALWKDVRTRKKDWEVNFGANKVGDTIKEYGIVSRIDDVSIFILE